MRSGKIHRRITLKRYESTTDSVGGITESFVTVATIWAEKLDIRGRDFFAANQVNSDITTKFRIRYRPDVNPSWRIVYEGKDYDLTSVAEIGRREGLEIMAVARVGAV